LDLYHNSEEKSEPLDRFATGRLWGVLVEGQELEAVSNENHDAVWPKYANINSIRGIVGGQRSIAVVNGGFKQQEVRMRRGFL
jgi:hypothetical protein